jgi:hypothetical protein
MVPTGTVADNAWTHIAVSVDGLSAKIYRNGVLEETLAMPAGFGVTNTNPLYIGSRADLFTNFDGCLDDVALFSGVLSQTQIAKIMTGDFSDFGVSSAPFQITNIQLDAATPAVTLTFNSLPGKTYIVEYSTALNQAGQPGGWIELTNSVASQGLSTTYVDTLAVGVSGRVFYRIKENP